MAEQERLTIRKRQQEGIDAAKQKGKHLGRPRIQISENFQEVYDQWKRKEITAKKAMEQLEISASSFYRLVKRYEEQGIHGKDFPMT